MSPLSNSVRAGASPAEALGDFALSGRVAIAIPDATRPVDVPAALAALMPRLPASTPVIVGLGLHRPMRADELAPLLPWKPVQHDPDNTVPTAEIDGIPGRVHALIAEAERSISVGVAELHQYAGLSGGHKGVAVGCGGRATIAALHHRDRVLHPGVRLGQLAGNPFRAAVDALGCAARCQHALLYVPARRIWLFGPPEAALEVALSLLDPWEPVARTYAGAVLRVPPAKASSFYQASRAATYLGLSPNPPVLPGGTLVLDAACPEGLGSEAGFVAALRGYPPPWEPLLSGPAPEGAGAQRAVMIALLAQKYHMRITGCVNPEALRAVGLDATADPPPAGPDWLEVSRPFERIPQRVRGSSRP